MNKAIPKDLTIAITYRCNLRCAMCNIWAVENPEELPLEFFSNLSPDLRYVNISGGEPFLHPQITEIIKAVKEISPKAKIIISTNGFAVSLITKKMAEILKIDPKIGVRVSIDGRREVHDEIRGFIGAYDQAMAAINELKAMGVKNLGIGFTAMDKNVGEIALVYDLAKKMKIQFAIGLVQSSESYFKKSDNEILKKDEIDQGLDYVINSELRSNNIKKWLRAYFSFGLKNYLLYKKNILPWQAGLDSLFISAGGEVYPNHLIGVKIGNLKNEPLESIWNSAEARKFRKEMRAGKFGEKWVMCAVRQAMKKNWPRVGLWIAANKLKRII
ncbi:MAG: radical SAM protein [Patescibacteria group bacterium]|jgi:MoaA/NifB/PqqE/SkfB family radical SAM enzyme